MTTAHSGQAELGQQRRDAPVGVHRHCSAGVVDLPDVHSGDVERAANGGTLAGTLPVWVPVIRHSCDPVVGGIDERFADRMESHVGEPAQAAVKNLAAPSRSVMVRAATVLPLMFGDHVERGGQVTLVQAAK